MAFLVLISLVWNQSNKTRLHSPLHHKLHQMVLKRKLPISSKLVNLGLNSIYAPLFKSLQQRVCPFYICPLIMWWVTYSERQTGRIYLLPTRKHPEKTPAVPESRVVVRKRRTVRYLQRLWSWACLSHSQRRGEKPRTSGVHQSYWEREISFAQRWSTVSGEPQGNRVFLVKQMTQTQSVKMWKCSARARVNKHYTAGWLLFKLNRYTQTSRKWMGWSILLISH